MAEWTSVPDPNWSDRRMVPKDNQWKKYDEERPEAGSLRVDYLPKYDSRFIIGRYENYGATHWMKIEVPE